MYMYTVHMTDQTCFGQVKFSYLSFKYLNYNIQ